MKKEAKKTVKKLVVTLFLLLCGLAGPGDLLAQAPAPLDLSKIKSQVSNDYSQILGVKTFIENLFKKAAEKNDIVAKDCLSPLATSANNINSEAEKAKKQAEDALANNDLNKASDGIAILAGKRESSKKLFGDALTCLSQTGTKKEWKEDVVILIQPLVTFKEGELMTLPEPSLEPSPWLSIYR